MWHSVLRWILWFICIIYVVGKTGCYTYAQRLNHTQPTIGFDPNFSDRWMSPNWTYWKACGWISSIGFIRLSQHVLLSVIIHVELEGTCTQCLNHTQPTIRFDPKFSDRWMSPNWTYWKACGWISSIGFIRLSQHVLLSVLIHVQLEGTYT